MIRGTPRRYQFEWILLGVVLLVLGALIGYWLYAERIQIETLERDRLQLQARIIDENLGHQLEGMDKALAGIRNDFPLWRGKNMGPAASRQLKALSNAMPGVRTLLMLDAAGAVLATSRDELVGGNFSEREYFKVPREHPDPGVLYVSPPFNTSLGAVVIAVTRAVAGPRGEFAGVVTAALDREYFNDLMRSVLYAPDMRAVLAHWDGKAFVFMPPNERMVGVDLAKPGSFFSRHRESGQSATLLTGTSVVSDEKRMMASRTFRLAGLRMDKPLVIHVSRELSAIYFPWHAQALAYAVFYGFIAVAALLGLHLLQRRRRGFDLAVAKQEKADRLLRHFFDLPFVGMAITSPGTKRWLQFNERLCEMLVGETPAFAQGHAKRGVARLQAVGGEHEIAESCEPHESRGFCTLRQPKPAGFRESKRDQGRARIFAQLPAGRDAARNRDDVLHHPAYRGSYQVVAKVNAEAGA